MIASTAAIDAPPACDAAWLQILVYDERPKSNWRPHVSAYIFHVVPLRLDVASAAAEFFDRRFIYSPAACTHIRITELCLQRNPDIPGFVGAVERI